MKGKAEEPAERCRACKRVLKEGDGRFRAGNVVYCLKCNGKSLENDMRTDREGEK